LASEKPDYDLTSSAASGLVRCRPLGEIGGLVSAELHLTGKLDIESADDFRQEFAWILESGVTQFFVDLSRVSYVDSSGLGSLVRLDQETKSRGGKTWFYSLTPPVSEIFSLTHLDKIIELHGTRLEAFAAAGKVPTKSESHRHPTSNAPEQPPPARLAGAAADEGGAHEPSRTDRFPRTRGDPRSTAAWAQHTAIVILDSSYREVIAVLLAAVVGIGLYTGWNLDRQAQYVAIAVLLVAIVGIGLYVGWNLVARAEYVTLDVASGWSEGRTGAPRATRARRLRARRRSRYGTVAIAVLLAAIVGIGLYAGWNLGAWLVGGIINV
jgi:anti-anti-sigma factor